MQRLPHWCVSCPLHITHPPLQQRAKQTRDFESRHTSTLLLQWFNSGMATCCSGATLTLRSPAIWMKWMGVSRTVRVNLACSGPCAHHSTASFSLRVVLHSARFIFATPWCITGRRDLHLAPRCLSVQPQRHPGLRLWQRKLAMAIAGVHGVAWRAALLALG